MIPGLSVAGQVDGNEGDIMKRIATVLAAVAAVGGCAKMAPSALPPAPTGGSGSNASYIAAADFIVGGVTPDGLDRFPMHGIVVLTEPRSGSQRRRNQAVCEGFVALPSVSVVTGGGIGSVPDAQVTPTFWLSKTEPSNTSNCAQLLADYDFDRAKAVLATMGRPGNDGPVLVAVKEQKIAFIDLAKANRRHVRPAVASWSRAMQKNNMNDIALSGGILREACDMVTSGDQNTVDVGVLELIAATEPDPVLDAARAAAGFLLDLVPFGSRLRGIGSSTCAQV